MIDSLIAILTRRNVPSDVCVELANLADTEHTDARHLFRQPLLPDITSDDGQPE